MNHLTNLYKHKCEQLQEQLNHLTRQLNEAAPPWWNGRPRISGIPDFGGPIPRPTGRNIPRIIRDVPNTDVNPNITPATHLPVPQSWTDLLNLGNANDPARMQLLINSLSSDTGFMAWWVLNHGLVRELNGIYQRLIHGTVWGWDNTLKAWQPINKPGTQTQFGQIGPGGALIAPEVNPNISNTDIPPFPWQPHNRPKPPPPPDTTGPEWNSGTNN
jgi:hypothetical protein